MDLKILQWNCRGIYRKLLEFKHYLTNLNRTPDVIALQETHLIQRYTPRIKNYVLIRKDRDVRGGGICFFVKNNLPFNEVELENLGEIEAQCISVQGVIITNVYIPPNHSIPKRYLERIFTRRNRRSVFVGDFNAHHSLWSDAVANTNGKYLYDILDAENLAIVNTTDPTRIDISRIKYSLLDLTIVSPSLAPNSKVVVTENLFGSDHCIIDITLEYTFLRRSSFTSSWLLRTADWTSFASICETAIPHICEEEPKKKF